jgi:hypothetical protein
MSEQQPKFFCHAYKSDTVSSKRSATAKAIQLEIIQSDPTCIYPTRVRKKRRRKIAKLSQIPTTRNSQLLFSQEILDDNQVLFDCFHDDPILHDLLPQRELFQPMRIENVYTGLQIEDNVNGSKLMEASNVPVYINIPRQEIVKHSSSAHGDVQALKMLLMKHNNMSIRGTKKTGISYQYATFGVHALRFGGLAMKDVKEGCGKEYLRILKLKSRAEFFAKMYLPFRVLTALNSCKEQLCDTFSPDPRQNFQECIWTSMAMSVNYMSPAHTDEDGFLGCLTVSYVPKNWEGKFMYSADMPVACYFCFPLQGIAVGLRPGDMLFFNPLHYHCASQRSEDYKEEDIYLTSFYIKSKQFGGNSNLE